MIKFQPFILSGCRCHDKPHTRHVKICRCGRASTSKYRCKLSQNCTSVRGLENKFQRTCSLLGTTCFALFIEKINKVLRDKKPASLFVVSCLEGAY